MPAETHSHTEPLTVETVLGVLAAVLGLDAEAIADVPLADVGASDTLAVLDLWEAVAEDLAERSVGDPDLDDHLPTTVGELAAAFHAALTG